jgi:sugar phosphate isomerase/epimerase
MNFELGVKSDPIEYRYSFEWLFSLMRASGVRNLQLGTFFELYSLPDAWFAELRAAAASYGVAIRSAFSAHRELGGFFSGDPAMEQASRRNYGRLMEVAALLGASYVGANPGAVLRDRMPSKDEGIRRYLEFMKEMMASAKALGLAALTIEPMSCSAEPPSFPSEIEGMLGELAEHHARDSGGTVPVYLCGDISHGLADREEKIAHGNIELFELGIPRMCEFHIKNTDAIFGSTFGFTAGERERGIVDLDALAETVHRRSADWPVETVVGYLEIGGPKLGRDYSDWRLEAQLVESLAAIKAAMARRSGSAARPGPAAPQGSPA